MKSLLFVLSAALVAAAPRSAPAVPQVTQHIPLHDGGWDILTVDREYHHVLISRTDGVFGPPPAAGGRPPIIPGTVELLVIR